MPLAAGITMHLPTTISAARPVLRPIVSMQYGPQGGYGQQGGFGQQGGLPAGWVSGVDQATGQTYYYNEQTGQSQWEAPSAQQQGGFAQQRSYSAGAQGWTVCCNNQCQMLSP